MVNLLHHYETQSNRIFLLLEHISGGQLVEHVQSIRNRFSEKRRKKATKSELAGTTTNRIVIGGEGLPSKKGDASLGTDVLLPGRGGVPPGTDLVSLGKGEVPQEKTECDPYPLLADKSPDEDDIIAKLNELGPPPSNPVLTSLTSISSDSDTIDEDSLTRLARIVKEDAAMTKIQEEEESLQSDRLSDLRRQLMESFVEDDDKDNHLHGDDLLGDREECVDDNGIRENECVSKSEQDTELVDERLQPDGEDLNDDEGNGEFSDLKKQLMAFVSTPLVDDDDKLGGVANDDKLEDVIEDDNSFVFVDKEHAGSDENDQTTVDKEQQSKPWSDNIIFQDPPSSTSISIIPPTPTTTVPKQPLLSSEQSLERLSSTNKSQSSEKEQKR